MTLSTTAGYTLSFIKNEQVKVFTFATADDVAIEKRLTRAFGKIEVIARAPLDQHALDLLRLKRNDWMEWAPVRADDRDI